MKMYPHYRPLVHKDSSCGSVVLATILRITTQEADMLMDLHAKKGWNGYTNVTHIRAVCEKNGIKMNKVNFKSQGPGIHIKHVNQPTALFIQMKGPWERKGWRTSYSYTHWALMLHSRVIDINNIYADQEDKRPDWLPVQIWIEDAMAHLTNSIDKCTGFQLRAMYEFIEVPK